VLDRLRRFEVQASCASWLAIVSLVPFVAALWLTGTRYHAQLGRIIYGSEGRFVPVFAATVLASLAPAALGLVLGWNSAGQRRNDRSSRSWLGFFLGGAVVSADIVLLLAFYMLRLERPM
jgi:uncharacterized membrane protein